MPNPVVRADAVRQRAVSCCCGGGAAQRGDGHQEKKMANIKIMVVALTFTVALSCRGVMAEQKTDFLYGTVYIMSLSLPRAVDVCDEKIPGYKIRFDKAYPLWRQRNTEAITKGEGLIREEAKRLNVDPDLYKSKRVDAPRDAIRKMQKERAIEMCEGNLRIIEAGV